MPTNLYGPGDSYHPTNSTCCRRSGRPLRDFLHVGDFGEPCVFALQHWDPSGFDVPRDQRDGSEA